MAELDILKTADIDPEFATAWEKIKDTFPDLAANVPAVRAHLAKGKASLAAANPDAAKHVSEEDLKVRGGDGYDIPIRIYRPTANPTGNPAIVLIHGGGFVLGDVDSETVLARLFAKEIGCTCISVDYRLAPEDPFPAAPNDCWAVTKWVATSAESLGVDLTKGFLVGGTSAGGNLTDVTAHTAIQHKLTPPITGLLELIPVLTSPSRMPEKYKHMYLSREQNKEAPILPSRTMAGFEAHYKADRDSPLYDSFNHPDGHTGIPPVYFAVCGMDPLRDDAMVYEKVLREEYGIKTKLTMYPGLPHGFWSFMPNLKTTQKFLEDTVEGVKWLLEVGKK